MPSARRTSPRGLPRGCYALMVGAGAPAPAPARAQPGQPDGASAPGERGAGRVRRAQAEERVEGPRRRGHAGRVAGVEGDGGERAGPGPGVRVGGRRPGGHGPDGPSGVRGSGVHRGSGGGGWGQPRDPVGGGEAPRGGEGVRAVGVVRGGWVVGRSVGWRAGFRRLARDYERLAETVAGWHWVAFVGLMLHRLAL